MAWTAAPFIKYGSLLCDEASLLLFHVLTVQLHHTGRGQLKVISGDEHGWTLRGECGSGGRVGRVFIGGFLVWVPAATVLSILELGVSRLIYQDRVIHHSEHLASFISAVWFKLCYYHAAMKQWAGTVWKTLHKAQRWLDDRLLVAETHNMVAIFSHFYYDTMQP